MDTKICTVCKIEKPSQDCLKLRNCCKSCESQRIGKWRLENYSTQFVKRQNYSLKNQERIAAYAKQRYATNKEAILEKNKKWPILNRERARELARKWQKNNLAKSRAITVEYKLKKKNAIPKWANKFFMKEAYLLAEIRSKMFGFKWHVDHIIPIQSKLVCGFHTHDNLRVIPATENHVKGNRYWMDMPT